MFSCLESLLAGQEAERRNTAKLLGQDGRLPDIDCVMRQRQAGSLSHIGEARKQHSRKAAGNIRSSSGATSWMLSHSRTYYGCYSIMDNPLPSFLASHLPRRFSPAYFRVADKPVTDDPGYKRLWR
jgi:hypothetical protein